MIDGGETKAVTTVRAREPIVRAIALHEAVAHVPPLCVISGVRALFHEFLTVTPCATYPRQRNVRKAPFAITCNAQVSAV